MNDLDKINKEINYYFAELKNQHLASNTRTRYYDELHKLMQKRQSMLSTDPTSEINVEIETANNAISKLEDEVYGLITQNDVISKALGDNTKESPKINQIFRKIEEYMNRIDKLQTGELDLSKERDEIRKNAEKHEQERNLASDTIRYNKEPKVNKPFWKSAPRRSTSNAAHSRQQLLKTAGVDTEKKYLVGVSFEDSEKLKVAGKNDYLRFDPYIKRWYTMSLNPSPFIKGMMLDSTKNKLANEWSLKIKNELDTLPPEERELTQKIHKTPEPAFWKKMHQKK